MAIAVQLRRIRPLVDRDVRQQAALAMTAATSWPRSAVAFATTVGPTNNGSAVSSSNATPPATAIPDGRVREGDRTARDAGASSRPIAATEPALVPADPGPEFWSAVGGSAGADRSVPSTIGPCSKGWACADGPFGSTALCGFLPE